MEIVSRVSRSLPVWTDVGPHVGFVGRFVEREARIPIDAVGAVGSGEVPYRRVESGDTDDQSFDECGKLLSRFSIARTIRFEPDAVVVALQLFQKFDYGFHAVFLFKKYLDDPEQRNPTKGDVGSTVRGSEPRSVPNEKCPVLGDQSIFVSCRKR